MITTDYNILQFASFINIQGQLFSFLCEAKGIHDPSPQGWNKKILVKIDAILKILFSTSGHLANKLMHG